MALPSNPPAALPLVSPFGERALALPPEVLGAQSFLGAAAWHIHAKCMMCSCCWAGHPAVSAQAGGGGHLRARPPALLWGALAWTRALCLPRFSASCVHFAAPCPNAGPRACIEAMNVCITRRSTRPTLKGQSRARAGADSRPELIETRRRHRAAAVAVPGGWLLAYVSCFGTAVAAVAPSSATSTLFIPFAPPRPAPGSYL